MTKRHHITDLPGIPPQSGPAGEMPQKDADLYHLIFDQFPDAVFVVALTGEILQCNEAALELYGYSREEMSGLMLRDLFPEEVAKTVPDLMDQTATGGVFVWVSSRKKSGTVFPIQYCNQTITHGGSKFVLVFVRDVSERYWCKHYLHNSPAPEHTRQPKGIPMLSLTWEKRNGDFVLIGYDAQAIESTKDRIKNYMGRTARELYRDREDILQDLQRCCREQAIFRKKTLYRMFSTGDDRITEITYVFVHPNLAIMHLEDFTERDTAVAMNQSLVKSSQVGLCMIHGGKFQFVNPKLQEYSGYAEAELLEIDPASLIHPDDLGLVQDFFQGKALPDTHHQPLELRLVTRQGDVRWVVVTFAVISYLNEQVLLMNLMDITDLKTARRKLDELTALQSSIMAAIPHAIIGLEGQKIVFVNHAVEDIFGWKPHELIGNTMEILFHDRNEYIREGGKLYEDLKSGERNIMELVYRTRDGRDVTCLTSISRITDDRKDQRLVTTHTDITGKKRAEESLEESRRMLATLMGNLPGMAYRCRNDWGWTMEFVSEGSLALTGCSPSDLIESARVSYGNLIHPEDRQMVWNSVQNSLKTREHFQIMYRIITQGRRVKWVWEKGRGIFSSEGKLVALEGLVIDITERKLAEEQLKRSRRLLSIHAEHLHTVLEGERAEIAREIHDELGQILTALKMDLFWVDRKLPGNVPEIHQKIHSMTEHIDSTIKTVERILLQLRPGLLEDLGLTPAIEWLAEEFQRRTCIVCEAILDPSSERAVDDEKVSTAIFRICQEGLTNVARHSRATRVEIVLRVGEPFLELIISDNGRGITRKDTLKPGSFGILGIKERIHLLGGKVTIAGRKGRGTTIRVRIPVQREKED